MDSTRTVAGIALTLTALLAACSAPSDEADTEVGTDQGAWDAESSDIESESTHLWIVDRGIDLLAKHAEIRVAALVVETLNEPVCRTNWQQGLLDADFKAIYNDGTSD